MMSLKTVGTLTWEACKTCQSQPTCQDPNLYQEGSSDSVSCADYLSISTDESEE
jgi:hypothetical protein